MSSVTLVQAATIPQEKTAEKAANFADKLYRQALYHYFSGHPEQALEQLQLNEKRFGITNHKSELFKAGLQLSLGLQNNASQTLLSLNQQQPKEEPNDISAELLTIATLQLAEQQIGQGKQKSAQTTLTKIQTISPRYVNQYTLLTQLAYWPESHQPSAVISPKTTESAVEPVNNQPFMAAYIELNNAMLAIKNGDSALASSYLIPLKQLSSHPIKKASRSFWQMLFNPFSSIQSPLAVSSDEQIQQQAISDYARMLLAQLYVSNGEYEAAFFELKSFPQQSPYAESALFLYAFSALKTKRYSLSLTLLNEMMNRYPRSNLGWQSSLLLANQVTEQASLAEGMSSYIAVEQLFKKQLVDLNTFEHEVISSPQLLKIYQNITQNTANTTKQSNHQFSDSNTTQWFTNALNYQNLSADFNDLNELTVTTQTLQQQTQTNQWIARTLTLNKQRQQKILSRREHSTIAEKISKLSQQRDAIASKIKQAELAANAASFANEKEQQWLARINRAKQLVSMLSNKNNMDEEQARLSKINGVMQWRLSQQFPARLWQHKQQLAQVNNLLSQVKLQQTQLNQLSNRNSKFQALSQRQKNSQQILARLQQKTEALKQQYLAKINEKLQLFIQQQRQLLNMHLLTTRHAMASVLERMAAVDKRIEQQLNPEQKLLQSQDER